MPRLSNVPFACSLALFLTISCTSGPSPDRGTAAAPPVAAQPTSEIPPRREFPVNASFKPCDDFYGYACSNVASSFKLRDDRSYHVFAFSDSNERLLEAKKKFLAGLSTEQALSPRGEALRTVYLACMDADAAKKEETELVKKGLDEMKAVADRAAFQALTARRVVSEDYSFLEFGALPNHDDPDRYDLYLLADLQSLPERAYYEKPEVMKDFEDIVREFFKTVGGENADARAKAVVSFEKEFSKTYPLPVEIRNLLNIKTGISRKAIQQQFPHLRTDLLLTNIPETTHIRDLTPKNFAWLENAMETTPLDTLKDVYLFHELVDYMDDAYPEFFKKRFDFGHKHLGGPAVRPDRQERCTQLIMHKFAKEIDAEILPRLFPDFPEEKFKVLAERVRGAIIDGVSKTSWLSPKSRKLAMAKMKAARLQLVKPRNDEEWDFNPPAVYSLTHPYENQRILRKNLILKKLGEMKTVRNRNKWDMGPLTVNAYYSPPDNKFVMPIGILQYPFYEPTLPDTTNLGAVGAVIGHELGHGIDDKGALYDAKGRLAQWLTPKDLAEFRKRGEKLVTQFNAAGFNGELTLGENIGDLVGVTFAYHAAFPKGKDAIDEKKAFFLQYARLWCTVIRPKYRELLNRVDPHSSGEARVNEQVKHQAGFQEAYGCKAGDKLYLPPAKRVRIW